MDNMLYVIAGLVLILLIGVMVLRKNKAQKPRVQPSMQAGRHAAANAPISKLGVDYHGSVQRNNNSDIKFDHITIAQRFVDQQRYDKAIETLNRGLMEKPEDNQLALKLLSIYATINQSEDFYRIYDAIKTHSNAATIKQADELKTLLVEERKQATAQVVPAPDNEDANFDIEFDLPTAHTNNEDINNEDINEDLVFDTLSTESTSNPEKDAPTTLSEPLLSDSLNDINDISAKNDNNYEDFDLTLDDLETNAANVITTNLTPVNQLDTTEEESFVAPTTTDFPTFKDTDNSDFTLDFDVPEEAVTLTNNISVDTSMDNSRLEEIDLGDEDFVLDFLDLEDDTDHDFSNNAAKDTTVQSIEDDFTLSLDSIDLSTVENKSPIDAPAITEDTDVNNTRATPTTLLTFDDHTFIGDDFDFDIMSSSPTVAIPVDIEENNLVNADVTSSFESDIENASDMVDTEIDTEVNTETATDFASRFAADFDFIKTLDSNQVTLDLAGQYLKLGEYDSAKRLLNEVMTQGNNQQQHQAQVLLDRTA